jgi:protein involved in polysaccharide export with SLBB domain
MAAPEGTANEEMVLRRGMESEKAETTLVLPVRGLNIPFADVALHDGDSVIVERFKNQWVSVLGLVNEPGNFVYPPDSEYRLADALALAGGLNLVADPRYVSVYRLRPDGTVASATFQFVDPDNQEMLTEQLAVRIKPGDVVSVEHTPRTRTNLFFDRVFRISLGLYLDPGDVWE